MFFHISWSSPIEVRYALRCFICACQIQYSTWKHDITSRHHSVTQWNENTPKTMEKLTFVFFNRSFFTQKIVDSNAWTTHFSCFKEDKRIQDNCETVQHERTVFPSRQKLQKLSKRKNIDTHLTNQNRYINIPPAWIWFVYSFISFAFLLQAQGRIWCVQEIPRKLTTTFDVDTCIVLPNASHRERAPPERRIWRKRVEV